MWGTGKSALAEAYLIGSPNSKQAGVALSYKDFGLCWIFSALKKQTCESDVATSDETASLEQSPADGGPVSSVNPTWLRLRRCAGSTRLAPASTTSAW